MFAVFFPCWCAVGVVSMCFCMSADVLLRLSLAFFRLCLLLLSVMLLFDGVCCMRLVCCCCFLFVYVVVVLLLIWLCVCAWFLLVCLQCFCWCCAAGVASFSCFAALGVFRLLLSLFFLVLVWFCFFWEGIRMFAVFLFWLFRLGAVFSVLFFLWCWFVGVAVVVGIFLC